MIVQLSEKNLYEKASTTMNDGIYLFISYVFFLTKAVDQCSVAGQMAPNIEYVARVAKDLIEKGVRKLGVEKITMGRIRLNSSIHYSMQDANY